MALSPENVASRGERARVYASALRAHKCGGGWRGRRIGGERVQAGVGGPAASQNVEKAPRAKPEYFRMHIFALRVFIDSNSMWWPFQGGVQYAKPLASCLLPLASCLALALACDVPEPTAVQPQVGPSIAPTPPALATSAPELPPELSFVPGRVETIGPITWELVGPAHFPDPNDLRFEEPYEILPGVDEIAPFPEHLLGATRIDSDGMEWTAIAVDADKAFAAVERYDAMAASVVNLSDDVWYSGQLPTGENPEWLEDGELDPPHPGGGIAYPELGYTKSYCAPGTVPEKWYWKGDNVLGALGEQVLPGGSGQPASSPYSVREEGPVVWLNMFAPAYTGTITIPLGIGGSGDQTFPDTTSPYTVQLLGSCSGTLIAPNLVLTAAHCSVGKPSLTTVCTDGNVFDAGPPATNVACVTADSIVTGPGFVYGAQTSYEYDWAIIKLSAPLTNVQPMLMSVSDPIYILNSSSDVYLAGYPGILGQTGLQPNPRMFASCTRNFTNTGTQNNGYNSFTTFTTLTPPTLSTPISSKRHRAQGLVDAVDQKSIRVDLTHGNGYSGGPYYYQPYSWFPGVIIGVHSIHSTGQGYLGLNPNPSAAGPRISYWRPTIAATMESL